MLAELWEQQLAGEGQENTWARGTTPTTTAEYQPGHNHPGSVSMERVASHNSGFRSAISELQATEEVLNNSVYIPHKTGKKNFSMF